MEPLGRRGTETPEATEWFFGLAFTCRALGRISFYLEAQLPRGSIVVPFGGSYFKSYKGIPKRNYYGASGYLQVLESKV